MYCFNLDVKLSILVLNNSPILFSPNPINVVENDNHCNYSLMIFNQFSTQIRLLHGFIIESN